MYEADDDPQLKGERMWAMDCAGLGALLGFFVGAVVGLPLAESAFMAPFAFVGEFAAAYTGIDLLNGAFATGSLGAALGLVAGWGTAEFADPIDSDLTASEMVRRRLID